MNKSKSSHHFFNKDNTHFRIQDRIYDLDSKKLRLKVQNIIKLNKTVKDCKNNNYNYF